MAIALFLFRVHSANLATADVQNNSQAASVVVVDQQADQKAGLQSALEQSFAGGKEATKLVIDDVKIGTGAEATTGKTVTVNYVGRLANGQEFDNSYKRGEPFTFTLGKGQVIPGWDKGIVGMKVGGTRTLVVPPSLGYGDQAAGPIPAHATLLFQIELLSVK